MALEAMDSPIPRLDLELECEGDDDPRSTASTSRSARAPPPIPIDPLQKRNLAILKEYQRIAAHPIEGVYVRPSEADILEWFGVIFVKTGIFTGGIFRFTLTLPPTFPDSDQIPTIELEQKNIYHPLIYPKTNRVDFRRFFPSNWTPTQNHIYHLLQAFQSIFMRFQCDVEVAANPEVALLWQDNRKQFKEFASLAVRESRTQIYGPPKAEDPNALRFEPWDATLMEPVREYLLRKIDTPPNEVCKVFGREKNPYASFFNVEKARFLCDPLAAADTLNVHEKADEMDEEMPPPTYEADDDSD